MLINEFIEFMEREINNINLNLFEYYDYSKEDLKAIEKLRLEKYSQDWWNYGSSPNYQYSKVKQFPGGLIEIYLQVNRGKIADIKIFGSYFFTKDTQEIEIILVGSEHTPRGIESRLEKINLSDYFNNVAREEFLSLFWD